MKTLSAAVLGTVCCDEIYRPGEKPRFGYGGIFYSLITLAQLFDKKGSIFPICKIGEYDYPSIIEQFCRYPAIRTKFIRQYPGRNNSVILRYYTHAERKEYSTHLPAPFTISELSSFQEQNARIFLVNFVSGREMRYRTFCALRKRLKMPLFVDLHSLFMGFSPIGGSARLEDLESASGCNGERYYFRNRDLSHWHESGDIVQMNRTEAQMLAGEPLENDKDFVSFGRYLLDKGATTVLITQGSAGSLVLWKSGKRALHRAVPVYHYGESQDPTGCGDVYSAAYVYMYLQRSDPPEAAEFASRVAGVRAVYNNSAELHNLRNILTKTRII